MNFINRPWNICNLMRTSCCEGIPIPVPWEGFCFVMGWPWPAIKHPPTLLIPPCQWDGGENWKSKSKKKLMRQDKDILVSKGEEKQSELMHSSSVILPADQCPASVWTAATLERHPPSQKQNFYCWAWCNMLWNIHPFDQFGSAVPSQPTCWGECMKNW